MHYLLVIAPLDAVFVGPFATAAAASAYGEASCAHHSRYVMSESEMRANIAEHGACPIQAPSA